MFVYDRKDLDGMKDYFEWKTGYDWERLPYHIREEFLENEISYRFAKESLNDWCADLVYFIESQGYRYQDDEWDMVTIGQLLSGEFDLSFTCYIDGYELIMFQRDVFVNKYDEDGMVEGILVTLDEYEKELESNDGKKLATAESLLDKYYSRIDGDIFANYYDHLRSIVKVEEKRG